MVLRTRSRRAGTASLVRPLVSMVSWRWIVTVAGHSIQYDGDAELLGQAEAAVLEFVDVAVAGTLGFGKNDEAGAAIDGVLREAPQAFDIGGATDVWDGDVAETLHEPAVGGNFEMRLEFPAAHDLWNRAVEDKGIEDVDVIDHEEAGAVGIEAGRAANSHTGSGEKRDTPAEGALQPVVLAHV